MKKTIVISFAGLLAALSALALLSTRGVQENGCLSAILDSTERPGAQNLVGITIPIDSSSYAKITALSRVLNTDGSTRRYRTHVDLFCLSKQSLSLREWSWKHEHLVSASKVESALRNAIGLPSSSDARLHSNSLLQ